MISEGSCDTEDWSNDAKKFSFEHIRNKLHFTIENSYFNIHNITVFLITLTQPCRASF